MRPALVIGAAIALIVLGLIVAERWRSSSRDASRILQLEQENRQLQARADSLQKLKELATLEALRAMTQAARSDQAARELRTRNQQLTRQHEELRKIRRVILSDSAILRKWAELYPDR